MAIEVHTVAEQSGLRSYRPHFLYGHTNGQPFAHFLVDWKGGVPGDFQRDRQTVGYWSRDVSCIGTEVDLDLEDITIFESHARVIVKRRVTVSANRLGGRGNWNTVPSPSSKLPKPSTVTRCSVQVMTLARLVEP